MCDLIQNVLRKVVANSFQFKNKLNTTGKDG